MKHKLKTIGVFLVLACLMALGIWAIMGLFRDTESRFYDCLAHTGNDIHWCYKTIMYN